MSASHLLPSSGRADSVNSLHCPAQIDFRSSQKPPLQTTDSWLKSILSPAYVCRYEDHVVRHMTNRRSDLIHPANNTRVLAASDVSVYESRHPLTLHNKQMPNLPSDSSSTLVSGAEQEIFEYPLSPVSSTTSSGNSERVGRSRGAPHGRTRSGSSSGPRLNQGYERTCDDEIEIFEGTLSTNNRTYICDIDLPNPHTILIDMRTHVHPDDGSLKMPHMVFAIRSTRSALLPEVEGDNGECAESCKRTHGGKWHKRYCALFPERPGTGSRTEPSLPMGAGEIKVGDWRCKVLLRGINMTELVLLKDGPGLEDIVFDRQ